MKVDSDDYETADDGGGYPINYEAKRRPPPGVYNVLMAVLPKVLEPMPEQPDHEEPHGSRDGGGGKHDKDARDRTFDSNDARSTVGHGEADVDGRDQCHSKRVDDRRIEPPEAERRSSLEYAESDPP